MIEVRYLDMPHKIQEKLSFSAENVHSKSAAFLLPAIGCTSAMATGELFGWPLDGSRRILEWQEKVPLWSADFSGMNSGYLGAGALGKSVLGSDDTGVETPPLLEVKVTECITVPGLTFMFAPDENQWCRKMELTICNGTEVVLEQTVFPDGPRWFFPTQELSFDRVTVRLLEANLPGRYIKLNRLYFGRVLVYSHRELESVRLVNEADPALDELTVDTMTVELRDLQQRELSPRKGQRMELYRDGELLASHWIEGFSRQEKYRYTFQCRSSVGQLEDTFLGGIFGKVPVPDLISQILEDVEFQIEGPLMNMVISGYLPVCTRRQALQQVVFAVGGFVSTCGVQGIRISSLEDQGSGSFQTDSLFRDGTVETSSGVSRIEVVAHQYGYSKERETLLDAVAFNGTDILLTFESPHYGYVLTGGTLLDKGANYIRMSAQGEVTLTAYPYTHTTRRHVRSYAPTDGISADQVRKVEQATMINAANVEALLNRLEKIYAMQHTLTQSVVVDGQFAGQQVTLTDPFGDTLEGYITTMDSELTPGGQTAKITVIGQRSTTEASVSCADGEEVALCV